MKRTLAMLAFIIALSSTAQAQHTTCRAYGDTMDCDTTPSVQQDTDSFNHNMRQLGESIRERRAERAAYNASPAGIANANAKEEQRHQKEMNKAAEKQAKYDAKHGK